MVVWKAWVLALNSAYQQAWQGLGQRKGIFMASPLQWVQMRSPSPRESSHTLSKEVGLFVRNTANAGDS